MSAPRIREYPAHSRRWFSARVHFGGSSPRKPRDLPSTTSLTSATITTIATPRPWATT